MTLPPLVGPAAALTGDEIRRYSRHLLMPEVADAGQRRLKAARVLCVGAGGLGSPVLLYLAAAGVGTVGIIDFDTVTESNLQRQIVHSRADVGRRKVESARDRVLAANPLVEVVTHDQVLTADNAMQLLARYDLVVDGADNFATRYLVNDACALLGKPYVWGSVHRLEGRASVFWAGRGPCYRCLHPAPPPAGMVPSCAESGVLGVVCASIGAIQATEAIKLLTGVGTSLLGRLLIYDAAEMEQRTVRVREDPACAVCGTSPTVTRLIDYPAVCGDAPGLGVVTDESSSVSVRDLAAMLRERAAGRRDFVLVDVREAAERAIVAIPGSVSIPLRDLLSGAARVDLPRETPVVLHCRTGHRSAQALQALLGAGFPNARHVSGGVLAWVREIEPDKPTY